VPRDRLLIGIEALAGRYRLRYDERLFDSSGFLAGRDEARLSALTDALAAPDVDAIFCARGGYGLTRILSQVDLAPLLRRPRAVVGFSDITALHARLQRHGLVSVHGPVVTQLGQLPADDTAQLVALLEEPQPPAPLASLSSLGAGSQAIGPLLGGNLELVRSLVGTPDALQLRGAVLLLEEIGERPYRIDRALTQLLTSGALDQVAGVLLGDFTGCEERDGAPPSAIEVVAERLAPLGVPVLAGAPIGHGPRNRAVPLGARVRLDGSRGLAEFIDAAVSPHG
jgi:muramoyltetrapeptide carboxypeptidase